MIAGPYTDTDNSLLPSGEVADTSLRYSNFEHLLAAITEASEARDREAILPQTPLPFVPANMISRRRATF